MSETERYNPQKFKGEKTKTVCAAFYKHTNIRYDGKAYACCRSTRPIVKVNGDLSTILHSKEYKALRQKTERGIKVNDCSKCYLEEEHGKKFSLRQEFNEKYGLDGKVEMQWIEMYANNICNLTCIMCWGEFSSAIWAKKNPDRPEKEGTKALKSIPRIPETVRRIRFMGGEPFMTSTHRKILQTVKDRNLMKTNVEYTTNGQFMLTPNDHALLSRCNHVRIDVSVDAFGGLNSVVREGADWEKIDRFIDDVINNTKYDIGVFTTLTNQGWKNFDKLAKWVALKQKMVRNTPGLRFYWMVAPVTWPENLCISRLSTSEKEQLIAWIEEVDGQFAISQKHYIKNILNSGK